jgi:hypothetical protein
MNPTLTALLILLSLFGMADQGTGATLPPLDLSGKVLGAWMYDDLGCTILLNHPHSAFPDSELSRTGVRKTVMVRRKVKGKVVRRPELRVAIPPAAFRDDRVLVFVPSGFSATQPVRLLVFFHGWKQRITAPNPVTEDLHLREIVASAPGNPILIVPQGPVDAATSRFGGLESVSGLTEFLQDLDGLLPPLPTKSLPGCLISEASTILLAGHSGGGSPIDLILMDGADRDLDREGPASTAELQVWDRVNTLVLLDATYDGLDVLREWWRTRPGRTLKSYFLVGTSTGPVSQGLMGLARERPDRWQDLDIEGIRLVDLPPERQATAHHDVPAMRMARALGDTPGRTAGRQ